MSISQPARLYSNHNWKSIALSFVVHLVVFLLLAFFIRLPPRVALDEPLRRIAVVLANVDQFNPSETEYLAMQDQRLDENHLAQPNLPPLEPRPPEKPQSDADRQNDRSADVGSLVAGAAQMTVGSNPSRQTSSLSVEDHKAIAADQMELAREIPAGPAATTTIFGSDPIVGRRFVFVLDRSKSMGAQGLNVLARAQVELMTALAPLTPEHSFQVIAYHEQTVSLDEGRLLPAVEANKNIVREFISNLAPYGSTDHEAGLYMALDLEPDAIILLTDGDLPDLHEGQVQALVKAANRRTTFHCIQFGSEPLEPPTSFMRHLAKQTGGSYRYVDASQWNKK